MKAKRLLIAVIFYLLSMPLVGYGEDYLLGEVSMYALFVCAAFFYVFVFSYYG